MVRRTVPRLSSVSSTSRFTSSHCPPCPVNVPSRTRMLVAKADLEPSADIAET
jgi:hypothetical protein